jgi:hypothetical protein
MIPWAKSGLFTLNTHTLTVFFSKTLSFVVYLIRSTVTSQGAAYTAVMDGEDGDAKKQVLNPPSLCDTHLLNPPIYGTYVLNPPMLF